MNDEELAAAFRERELVKRAAHRQRLLKEMDNLLAADKEVAPTDVEVAALLAIGRSQMNYEAGVEQAMLNDWRRQFAKLSLWRRLRFAWRKGK